ncbi:MAG: aspartate--tRNA ligase [Bacilli bacterium]|nr:aspartate--tRNA ligase [Bacilli bacterium]
MKQYKNNKFRIKNVGEEVTLYGWINKKRNLGGLIFLDLRDRSGIIQAVVRPEIDCYSIAESLKNEYVVALTGIIKERESKNPNMDTGEIELEVSKMEILNTSKELPFEISDNTTALEDTRLKYRYLDLRRNNLKENMLIRHQIMKATREFLDNEYFVEVETPILCKSTPEGARDYLVPSRVNKGKFYALPQSPQLFKQLLMISGMERYYQIAKCFRDEDLRADRQPEFTQIDLEMSFVDQNDVMDLAERLTAYIFKKVKDIDVELPLLKMEYDDAINIYGSDKPDLRFDMKIEDITNIFKNTEFGLFKTVIEEGGIINAIVAKNAADKYSRKNIDALTEFVKTYGATGLAYLKFVDNELSGSIVKPLSTEELTGTKQTLHLENNDIVFIIANKKSIVKASLGALRLKLGKELNLIDPDDYKLLWVVNFPVFEYSEEEGRYMACHHPFTAPQDSDVDKLMSDPGSCYAKAYDIVINGYEAGGGSIRIHNGEVQKKMFEALGFTEESAKEKFGFFIDAFAYGTPPHGGLAFGLDRLTMLLAKTENIRDVIAFPKTASASDLMSEAPNIVDEKQLEELGIKLREK